MKHMTRENQKLIYWFIDCYAYHLKGIEINWKSSKNKPIISDFFKWKAKTELKKLYIRSTEKNIKVYKPFDNLNEKLYPRIIEILEKKYTNKNKANLLIDMLKDFVIEEIQMLFMKFEDSFSLSLKLFSNQEAINFTNILFDFFMENNIPMWNEMQQLYRSQENRKWVYWMLKTKTCVITGKPNAQLAHMSHSAGALGGYKHDAGIGNSYLPLCVEWHIGVDHGVDGGREKLNAKLKEVMVEPFFIETEEELLTLKKIYKNHFQGYKKEK